MKSISVLALLGHCTHEAEAINFKLFSQSQLESFSHDQDLDDIPVQEKQGTLKFNDYTLSSQQSQPEEESYDSVVDEVFQEQESIAALQQAKKAEEEKIESEKRAIQEKVEKDAQAVKAKIAAENAAKEAQALAQNEAIAAANIAKVQAAEKVAKEEAEAKIRTEKVLAEKQKSDKLAAEFKIMTEKAEKEKQLAHVQQDEQSKIAASQKVLAEKQNQDFNRAILKIDSEQKERKQQAEEQQIAIAEDMQTHISAKQSADEQDKFFAHQEQLQQQKQDKLMQLTQMEANEIAEMEKLQKQQIEQEMSLKELQEGQKISQDKKEVKENYESEKIFQGVQALGQLKKTQVQKVKEAEVAKIPEKKVLQEKSEKIQVALKQPEVASKPVAAPEIKVPQQAIAKTFEAPSAPVAVKILETPATPPVIIPSQPNPSPAETEILSTTQNVSTESDLKLQNEIKGNTQTDNILEMFSTKHNKSKK